MTSFASLIGGRAARVTRDEVGCAENGVDGVGVVALQTGLFSTTGAGQLHALLGIRELHRSRCEQDKHVCTNTLHPDFSWRSFVDHSGAIVCPLICLLTLDLLNPTGHAVSHTAVTGKTGHVPFDHSCVKGLGFRRLRRQRLLVLGVAVDTQSSIQLRVRIMAVIATDRADVNQVQAGNMLLHIFVFVAADAGKGRLEIIE